MNQLISDRLAITIVGALITPPTFSRALLLPANECTVDFQVTVIAVKVNFAPWLTVSLQLSNDEVNWADVSGSGVSYTVEGEIGLKEKRVTGLSGKSVRLKYAPGTEPEIGAGGMVILASRLNTAVSQ